MSKTTKNQEIIKMEQNLPIIPKKLWSLLRLFYYMLRKGISKNKLWLDLNMMMKRAKIACKSLHNLMFHHHHNWVAFAINRPSHHLSIPSLPPSKSEFSCTNSPSVNNNNPFTLLTLHKKKHSGNHLVEGSDVIAFNAAVLKAIDMIDHSEMASPELPGFGRTPLVRQLRITDSPFPVSNVDDDYHVDEDAEQFINRFYNNLRQQKRIYGG